MRRVFWVAVGAVAAVAILKYAEPVARKYAPDSVAVDIAGRAGRVLTTLGEAPGTLLSAARSREAELRDALYVEQEIENARAFRDANY